MSTKAIPILIPASSSHSQPKLRDGFTCIYPEMLLPSLPLGLCVENLQPCGQTDYSLCINTKLDQHQPSHAWTNSCTIASLPNFYSSLPLSLCHHSRWCLDDFVFSTSPDQRCQVAQTRFYRGDLVCGLFSSCMEGVRSCRRNTMEGTTSLLDELALHCIVSRCNVWCTRYSSLLLHFFLIVQLQIYSRIRSTAWFQ